MLISEAQNLKTIAYLGIRNLITLNHVTYGNTYLEDYLQTGNLGLSEDLIFIPPLILGSSHFFPILPWNIFSPAPG